MSRLGGRFVTLETAGRGASGEVFRAIDETNKRLVALKVFAAEGRDAEKLDRFVREARLLSEVESRHVVGYVAHGVEPDGSAYLAVEWLEGEDLAKRSKRETLDGPKVVEVITQAARGLEALHLRGIVHRDVKPSNLFLTTDADGAMLVKLLDLGVARTLSDPGLTRHGTMIGTPSYMSPEQVLGGVDLSFRSDIFSLGVVLFELVAGVRPYVAEDIFAVVAKIALQDPPRLAAIAPGVSAELDAVVARAMAKRPEDRFASASDLAEAVARVPPFTPRSRLFAPKEEETHTAAVRSIATTERRIVTVLFARFATPDAAGDARDRFETEVKSMGGTPYTLLARAHVGIFGGERSAGDEAARAARAALALRDRLGGASITVATGRAEAGGNEPTGEAIDRGARGADQRSSILRVDQVTARLLGDAFELEGSAPWLTLRGERVAPMRVRTLLGRPTPCVGRDREIAHLESLYAEVETESVARAALVLAPPGGGKSRIRHELLSRFANRPTKPIVLLGRGASAFGGGSPFGLIGSAIRAHARIQADEPIANQRQKLGATIREGTTSTFMPLLAQIAAVDEQPQAVGEGMFVADLVRDAFERWVEQVTQTAPLVIVFEDVHAGDVASVALVESILRNHPELPVLALAFGRPEAEQRFAGRWAGSAPVTIRLPKLSKRAQAELATAVLGKSATPEIVDRIVSLADGNAFYLEELVRRVSDGAAGDEDGLPDTVLAMLQARLDALGDDSKRALKAASVFGDGFWPGAIANVLGDEIDHTGAALGRMMRSLVDAEVLERRQVSRFAGEDELVFRSQLLREASYGLLAEADREVAHRRAASWLALHGEQDHLSLARHFELGGQRDKASSQFAHAAEQALFGNDYAGAVDSAARALSCGASGEVRGRIQVMVAEAERWRGGIPAALDAAREACKLLPAGTLAWFHAMRERVAAEGRLANKDAIVSLAEELLSASSEPEARSAQIAALVPAAVHLLYVGHKARAQGLALGVEGLAARAGPGLEPRARARLSQLRAALAAAEDDLGRAIDEQERALALFEGATDHRAAALVCSNLAFQWYAVGNYERAEALLRRALATAKRLGLATIGPLAKQNLGAALFAKGELDESIAVQTEAADTFAEQHDPRL
ncbi:MAG: protein kinase, partial [Polyangiaceae bacterium]|nr:protein kinase [Polyangiaceae bacterium]